jgi:hypothetical protein
MRPLNAPRGRRCTFCPGWGDRILVHRTKAGKVVERRCTEHTDTTGLVVLTDKVVTL